MKFGFLNNAHIFPLMIHVNMAYVCNAKCVHCVHVLYPNSREAMGEDIFISDAVFRKLADECGPHGAFLRITGHGEPLLHPRFLDLIKYAKKKGCKVSIITNGSLLDKHLADELLSYGVEGIEFSVDATTKETYEKIRHGLKYEKLLENISYVRRQRDKSNANTNLIVSFIEESENRHERTEAAEFWAPKYVDNVQFRIWLQYGKMKSVEMRRNLMSKREPCPYPFERLIIDSRGGLHLCAFDIEYQTNFGNILEKSLLEIWQCREINEVRRLLLEKRFDEIPICSKCTDWGCRSWTYNFWKIHEDTTRGRAK